MICEQKLHFLNKPILHTEYILAVINTNGVWMVGGGVVYDDVIGAYYFENEVRGVLFWISWETILFFWKLYDNQCGYNQIMHQQIPKRMSEAYHTSISW